MDFPSSWISMDFHHGKPIPTKDLMPSCAHLFDALLRHLAVNSPDFFLEGEWSQPTVEDGKMGNSTYRSL